MSLLLFLWAILERRRPPIPNLREDRRVMVLETSDDRILAVLTPCYGK
jgi:hypothetical protein